MEFKEFLIDFYKEIDINKSRSKDIADAFLAESKTDEEKLQAFELKCIISIMPDLFERLLDSVSDKRFDQVSDYIERICLDLESENIFAPNYSYFIYCFYNYLSTLYPNWKDIDPVDFPKFTLQNNEVTLRKSFKNIFLNILGISREDFVTRDTKLVKYNGESSFVIVPDGITEIGEACFKGNGAIRFVYIPNSVEIIDANAFDECVSLEQVLFSSKIQRISNAAFHNCYSLHTICNLDSVIEVCESAFEGCRMLSHVDFSMSLAEVNSKAFSGCINLCLNSDLVSNIKLIGERAFEANNLKSVVLRGCTVRDKAFRNCINIGLAVFDENCSIEGSSIFEYDYQTYSHRLSTLAVLCNVTRPILNILDSTVFDENYKDAFPNLKQIKTSGLVDEEFHNLPRLDSVITSFNEGINDGAFYRCEQLQNLKLSPIGDIESPKWIGKNAFAYAYSLKDISFAKDATRIEDGAFAGCVSVKDLSPLSNATYFGKNALVGVSLDTFAFDRNWEFVGSKCFYDLNAKYRIPVVSLGEGIFEEQCFQAINDITFLTMKSDENLKNVDSIWNLFDEDREHFVENYKIENIIDNDLKEGMTFKGFNNVSHFEVTNYYNTMTDELFCDCRNATSIIFKNSYGDRILNISASAFEHCLSLTDLEFGEYDDLILNYASFSDCPRLPLSVDLTKCSSIGNFSFAYNSQLTEIHFSEKLQKVGVAPFYHCENIKKVILPFLKNVKSCPIRKLSDLFDNGDEKTNLENLCDVVIETSENDFCFKSIDVGTDLNVYLPNIETFDDPALPSTIRTVTFGKYFKSIPTNFMLNARKNNVEIIIDKENPNITFVNGSMLTSDLTELIDLHDDNDLETFTSLERIYAGACSNYSKEELILKGVEIEENAFGESNNIKDFIFDGCSGYPITTVAQSEAVEAVELSNMTIAHRFVDCFKFLKNLLTVSLVNIEFQEKEPSTAVLRLDELLVKNCENFHLDNSKISLLTIDGSIKNPCFNNTEIDVENLCLFHMDYKFSDLFTSKDLIKTIDCVQVGQSELIAGAFSDVNIKKLRLRDLDEIPDYCFKDSHIERLYIEGNPKFSTFAFFGTNIDNIEFVNSPYRIEGDFIYEENRAVCCIYDTESISDLTLQNGNEYTSGLFKNLTIQRIIVEPGVVLQQGVLENCKISTLECPYFDTSLVWVSDSFKTVEKVIFNSDVIGEEQFADFISLKEIQLNSDLKSVGSYAFENCSNLKEFDLSKISEEIGDFAFSNTGLRNIKLGELKHIGACAFNNVEPSVIDVPFIGPSRNEYQSFEYLFGSEFYKNKNKPIAGLTIRDGQVDEKIFGYMSKLFAESILLPPSFDTIKAHQFEGFAALKYFNLENIKSIGEKGLYHVALRPSVIGKPNAFNNLVSVGKNGVYLFSDYKGIRLSFPNLKTIGEAAFKIDRASFDFSETKIRKITKMVFDYGTKIDELVLPETLEEIGDFAFKYIKLKRSLVIPKSVTKVGERIFYKARVKRIIVTEDQTVSWNRDWNKDVKGFIFKRRIKPKYNI